MKQNNNAEYVIEPCMIGDGAEYYHAERLAAWLSDRGYPCRASRTEGVANDPELAPPDAVWAEGVEAVFA